MSSAPICAGVALPDITSSKASAASASVREAPDATLAIAPRRSASAARSLQRSG